MHKKIVNRYVVLKFFKFFKFFIYVILNFVILIIRFFFDNFLINFINELFFNLIILLFLYCFTIN